MSTLHSGISSCRHCLHYQTEGRRGGTCTQLGVPVQACWQACPLAAPFFASAGEKGVGVPAYASALMAQTAADESAVAAIAPTPMQSERHAADVIPISAAHHHGGSDHGTAHRPTAHHDTAHSGSIMAELPYTNHLTPTALA